LTASAPLLYEAKERCTLAIGKPVVGRWADEIHFDNFMNIRPDIHTLRELTKDFTSESIADKPDGLCFATAFPLKIYLATKGIKGRLRVAKVPKLMPDNNIIDVDHFWLQVPINGIMLDLDPTIKQFDKSESSIYVGKLAENTTTKKYKLLHSRPNIWFPKVYDDWRMDFDNPKLRRNVPFIKKSMIYSIKLAIVLNKEVKKMPFHNKYILHYFGLYFTPIFIFLNTWLTDKTDFEDLREQLPKDFDDLLADVQTWAKTGQG